MNPFITAMIEAGPSSAMRNLADGPKTASDCWDKSTRDVVVVSVIFLTILASSELVRVLSISESERSGSDVMYRQLLCSENLGLGGKLSNTVDEDTSLI